jgi:uncharacterized protein (TIGR00730 family)
MQYICVYCGSQVGSHERYRQAAMAMGVALAERGYGLVYGGGKVGLMGIIARTVLARGGKVIGVIPEAMVGRELAFQEVTQLHVEPSMHDRKARMAECSDAFIALPGGYGTLEELFEIITWAQLGIHQKPIGLLNIDGYFNAFVTLIDHAITEGFIRPEHREFWTVAEHPDALLDTLAHHTMPAVRPWPKKDATTGKSSGL